MEDIIKPIAAPSLESSEYGQNIKDQFKNIDNNFKFVSNRDFIKGDSGESLYIENIILKTSGEGIGKELYDALNSAIGKRFNSERALNPVNDYNWDDAITSGELNVPIIASENKTTGEAEYICAASPVMLFDNRFNEKAINDEDFSKYEDVVDVTSILNFKKDDDGNWVCELNLSYPRLQYENGSFCWVINNENTIVKSTGIKGDPGESANIWIALTEDFSDNYEGEYVGISKYFDRGEWTFDAPKNIKDGDLAIVHCESKDKKYYGFFVSQIKIEDDNKTIAYYSNANIQNINYVKNTTEFFKSLGNTNAARGMFLKFDSDSPNSTDAHIFYNDNENLFIKPVGNYDYTGVEDYNGEKQPSINIEGYSTTNITSPKIELTGAVTVGDGLEITTGNLTVSKGDLNADKNVNIKNNISFLSGSNGDKHQIIINGNSISTTDSSGNNISITTGTTGSELTVWASNIHLAGNKNNSSNIITLGNAGLNESGNSNVNIQGDLYIKPTGKNKGSLTVSDVLTVTNGKIDMAGVTLTGKSNGEFEINASEVGITGGDLIDLTVANGVSGLQITPDGNTISCGMCGIEVAEDVITLNGLTEINGDLTVNNGDSRLQITDNSISISCNQFNIKVEDGGIALNGYTELDGDLTVTGTTKLNNNLTVSGAVGLNNLTVTETTTLKDLTVSGTTELKDLTIVNDLTMYKNIFAASSVLFLDNSTDWDITSQDHEIAGQTGRLAIPKKPAYMLRLKRADNDRNTYVVGIPADIYPPNCIVMMDFNANTYYLHNANDLDGFSNTFRIFVFGTGVFTQTVGGKEYTFRKPIGWIQPGYSWVDN